jgi:TonB family protein
MNARASLLRWLAVPALALTFARAAEPATSAPTAAAAQADLVSLPLLNTWVAPVYPAKALADRMPARIRVRFIVDDQGAVAKARVLESSNEAFNDAAVQAILQWRFAPATEGGKTTAKCMEVTVPFDPPDPKAKSKFDAHSPPAWTYTAVPSPTTKAAQKTDKSAVYPSALLPLMLRGEVQVSFTVDPEGRIRAPRVLQTTHPDFVAPALAAMSEWTFRPAYQGDLPIPTTLITLVRFDLDFPPKEDRLAACGVTLAETPETISGLGRKPEPFVVVEPVYPYDLLLAGTTGEAEAQLVISPGGRPTSVTVGQASDPAFGRALAMAGLVFPSRPPRRQRRFRKSHRAPCVRRADRARRPSRGTPEGARCQQRPSGRRARCPAASGVSDDPGLSRGAEERRRLRPGAGGIHHRSRGTRTRRACHLGIARRIRHVRGDRGRTMDLRSADARPSARGCARAHPDQFPEAAQG